jgi:hypothetical protein
MNCNVCNVDNYFLYCISLVQLGYGKNQKSSQGEAVYFLPLVLIQFFFLDKSVELYRLIPTLTKFKCSQ